MPGFHAHSVWGIGIDYVENEEWSPANNKDDPHCYKHPDHLDTGPCLITGGRFSIADMK